MIAVETCGTINKFKQRYGVVLEEGTLFLILTHHCQ